MIAYKATKNMKCMDKTYKVGKTYTYKGELELCSSGFHFCKVPDDTLEYYPYNNRYILLEIEVLGDVIDDTDKSVTNKFKVLRVIPKEEYNSIFTRMKFDERGNLLYYKNSYGYEEWYEYDKNDNLIYYKDSKKVKFWREYDKNNNLIYSEDSKGSKIWQEFDERNNLIHYKDSYGVEQWRKYDERNNCIHIKDCDGYEVWQKFDENNNMIHYKNSHDYEHSFSPEK